MKRLIILAAAAAASLAHCNSANAFVAKNQCPYMSHVVGIAGETIGQVVVAEANRIAQQAPTFKKIIGLRAPTGPVPDLDTPIRGNSWEDKVQALRKRAGAER
jgi:hypothetical protein